MRCLFSKDFTDVDNNFLYDNSVCFDVGCFRSVMKCTCLGHERVL